MMLLIMLSQIAIHFFQSCNQLGVGTGTSYNVTLNLTGHILLAIGIATSLLAYMFLNDMGQEESYNSGGYNAPSSGYGDRYGRYRSHHYVKKV